MRLHLASAQVGKAAGTRSLRMFSDLWVTTNTGETTDSTDLSRQVGSISAQNQQIEAFRHCPRCGADNFTQGASRANCLADNQASVSAARAPHTGLHSAW